ncbi:hypothetical protein K466DRAFT_601583 [Polyporus arcularius HHB13444]|uniref:F-box domain-containing protein n=1 Tax=Polyporus arcularius HHB13444 TaxID=1314778 RepID=A0A5C3P6R9_9APHY|nr:hypothetical protein K466DRAFT_601583 [Polyporus arcularius HHB13444]
MPTFPTELTDEIIAWIPVVCDRFSDMYRALLSCSLVCSAWLPASRHWLFGTLKIDTAERYDLLVSRVLRSEKMSINLLSVRIVELFGSDPAAPSFARPFMLEFAGHLPNVEDMAFYDASVEAFLSHPTSQVAMSRFSLVQSLSISRCKFPSFGAVRRTLTSLPSLDNLELFRPSWPDPATDLSPHLSHGASTARRPALLALNITMERHPPGRRRAQQFMTWFSKTPTSSSLLDLRVRVHNWKHVKIEDMATFGPSLFCFGRGLRTLDIEIAEILLIELERFFCTITNLEVLRLGIESAIEPDIWVHLERLAHSLPCPTHLVELYIGVGFTRFPLELAKFDGLEALDAALRLELFQALQTVKLHCKTVLALSLGPPSAPPSAQLVQRTIPLTASAHEVAVRVSHTKSVVIYTIAATT